MSIQDYRNMLIEKTIESALGVLAAKLGDALISNWYDALSDHPLLIGALLLLTFRSLSPRGSATAKSEQRSPVVINNVSHYYRPPQYGCSSTRSKAKKRKKSESKKRG